MKVKQAASFLRAFGDPTRLRIVYALSEAALTVSELAQLLRCPPPRVSRHLQYLHARGVVDCKRRKEGAVYSLDGPRGALHELVLQAILAAGHDIAEAARDKEKMVAVGM
ncbi:winged helix-turn-helix transcriptional regulator [bacterium]|nr:winged helix-turn-helix transcriptional regulator [bacterium]